MIFPLGRPLFQFFADKFVHLSYEFSISLELIVSIRRRMSYCIRSSVSLVVHLVRSIFHKMRDRNLRSPCSHALFFMLVEIIFTVFC